MFQESWFCYSLLPYLSWKDLKNSFFLYPQEVFGKNPLDLGTLVTTCEKDDDVCFDNLEYYSLPQTRAPWNLFTFLSKVRSRDPKKNREYAHGWMIRLQKKRKDTQWENLLLLFLFPIPPVPREELFFVNHAHLFQHVSSLFSPFRCTFRINSPLYLEIIQNWGKYNSTEQECF
ncbi:hypothetical protein EBS02_10335, partial [bacterium]|nr:hypothetical protein [bacterium]